MIAGANVIRMDGKAFQPLKKGFAKDQLLKLPRLDLEHHQVFLVDENKEHRIDSEEGIELLNGMEFPTTMVFEFKKKP